MELGAAVRETSGTVRGWRAWIVTETPAGPRLGSVLHELTWPVALPVLAACRREEDPFAVPVPVHPVPDVVCNCGFHAARDPADALSYLRGRDPAGTVCRILGEVSLWGHVVETESGWRASHAYPALLYVPDASLGDALAGYGVPISSAECASPSVTSSKAGSAGSSTSSCSGPRMPSLQTAVSG
jgi:hypothetical protein